MTAKYALGLDFGTNSVRALIVNVTNGDEIASSVYNYPSGQAGIVLDEKDPNVARQRPADYLAGTIASVQGALQAAAGKADFTPEAIIGIGVDTTGSTPIPVNAQGTPLALLPEFENDPNAMAWLWKDHTGFAEAQELTAHAKRMRPEYLEKCGGTYSSEWFWSKILRCKRVAPQVFAAAFTWVEHADWLPAVLTGTTDPKVLKRCICAAGHKAFFNKSWGGYPDAEFLAALDPALAAVRKNLPDQAYNVADAAGRLTGEWAGKLGLKAGIPVAVGAFDAHLGAVGSGIRPGTLVKIIGTSTCDMMVATTKKPLPDIPGLCGVVPESILPGYYGLEAGQSAVGDIFNWYVNYIQPGGKEAGSHEKLTEQAEALAPGQSGLLALDWNNGNRTVLVDQRLTGGVIGLTLHTRPAEIYRALIEATAFGARAIVERFEEYNQHVERVVNCGGISIKNPMVMQIYADVLGRPLEISRSAQTCALGAAICGAVVAGQANGGYDDFATATAAMTGIMERRFTPNPAAVAVYDRLYKLYKQLHDAFGVRSGEKSEDLYNVMKDLLAIRDEALKG
jgi:L-ribulokinase